MNSARVPVYADNWVLGQQCRPNCTAPGAILQTRFHMDLAFVARAPWAVLASVVLLAFLGACDPQRIAELEEGVATESDVRAKFGEPEQVWEAPDGVRIFEYNRNPEGHKNYMISIGADGKMSALRQVLTPENFAKVTPGMPYEQVRKMLGKPASVQRLELVKEVHYAWRFMEGGPAESRLFTVVVDPDMKVLRTSTGPDLKSPDHKGS